MEDSIKVPVPAQKVSYTELQLPPTISIIVYVKDADSEIEFTLMSILNQHTRDFEIIIIDSSKNGVGNICRKFAGVENFTLLKVKNTVDKYEAFNIGLNCARGLYVQFLTGNSFVAPNALHGFFHTLKIEFENNYFHRYSEIQQRLKFSNYDYVMNNYHPHVILSVNVMNESENGNFNIDNKKFDILCDENFVNLNQIENATLNPLQKLNLFAGRQLNDLLGTKLFQLKFLNENNIRFRKNENSIDSDPALLFQIETMLLTNKITFVPNIFLGIIKKVGEA